MIERRNIKIEDKELQTRSAKNDKGQLEIIGFANLFNHRSKPLVEKIKVNGIERIEKFTETIDQRALDKANMDDVIYTIDHNPSLLVARKSAGNLSLEVTEKGFMFRATPPDTTLAVDLAKNIESGNYQENSFQFRVKSDKWTREENGMLHRHILEIDRVADVSTVLEGAYSNTDVATRSITVDGEVSETPVIPLNEIEKDTIDFEFLQLKGKQIA
jgi:HK97 family phage prohead protease